MKFLAALLILMGVSAGTAFASELDREGGVVNAERQLEGTTVLRVDKSNGSVAVLRSNKVAETESEIAALANGPFKAVPAGHNVSELDRDAGASSWYFCYQPSYNNYSYGYNSYYYYGSYYSPYYNYSYNNYDYYYYGSSYGSYNRRW